jgi:hypothetical protein
MKAPYCDIVDRLGDPIWWDENGTPRYCEFYPGHLSCIYAREAILFCVACQACGKTFAVAMSSGPFSGVGLLAKITDHGIHYGDPPNAGCCAAGPTMNSEPQYVISAWRRNIPGDWERVSELDNVSLK